MKNPINKIFIFVLLSFMFPLISSAQYFKFDTTNCTFLKVERNTEIAVVTITLKTKKTPNKEIFNFVNVETEISFECKSKNFGGKNTVCWGQKYWINNITKEKDNIIIELRKNKTNHLISDEEKMMHSLMPDETSPDFKFIHIKTVNE